MKQRYLKTIIITGFIVATLIFGLTTNAQEDREHLKLLTEISMDIKYIKNNIAEIKKDNRTIKDDAIGLGSRVTRVEERQITIKADIFDISERSNWITGIIGSVLILMLGLQLKRSYSHRKNDNGKTAH